MSTEKFNVQAQASIDQIDLAEAQSRVDAILGPKGLTAVPDPQKPARKPRSDKGVPKKAPADPYEVTLKFDIPTCQRIALWAMQNSQFGTANHIHKQIELLLQKRIDFLERGH